MYLNTFNTTEEKVIFQSNVFTDFQYRGRVPDVRMPTPLILGQNKELLRLPDSFVPRAVT